MAAQMVAACNFEIDSALVSMLDSHCVQPQVEPATKALAPAAQPACAAMVRAGAAMVTQPLARETARTSGRCERGRSMMLHITTIGSPH